MRCSHYLPSYRGPRLRVLLKSSETHCETEEAGATNSLTDLFQCCCSWLTVALLRQSTGYLMANQRCSEARRTRPDLGYCWFYPPNMYTNTHEFWAEVQRSLQTEESEPRAGVARIELFPPLQVHPQGPWAARGGGCQ